MPVPYIIETLKELPVFGEYDIQKTSIATFNTFQLEQSESKGVSIGGKKLDDKIYHYDENTIVLTCHYPELLLFVRYIYKKLN